MKARSVVDTGELNRTAQIHRTLSGYSYRGLLFAGITGVLAGLGVAGFEWVTRFQVFDRLVEAPLWVQAVVLLAGLVASGLALRYVAGGATPSTSDEYIRSFHDPDHQTMPSRPVIGRLLAGAATLGTGGALGYEGPSLYMGASMGAAIQRRWPQWFRRANGKALMVAGAAAGVAAIFKAPATGAIFALEVPYRDDTARHVLLPALIGGATGYLAFAAVYGTAPLFAVEGSPPFDLRELIGAVGLGLLCGLVARGYAYLFDLAKRFAATAHPVVRVVLPSACLAGLLVASRHLFGEGLATGSGYRTLAWVTEPGHSFWMVLALLGFRIASSSMTLAGGGVGGLFVPLVVAGAVLGHAVEVGLGDTTNLFPLIGVAALLGAGYRTPLAGVVFVAEATGRPGFIVPGLMAAVVAQLVMGDSSVSAYQSEGHLGHLERRFALPITRVIRADVLTVPPDATLREFYDNQTLFVSEPAVAVMDGTSYLAMIGTSELYTQPPDTWDSVRVGDVMKVDWPRGSPDWTIEQALRALEEADVDVLPVLDARGEFVGTVTTDDILRLDEILDDGTESRGDLF